MNLMINTDHDLDKKESILREDDTKGDASSKNETIIGNKILNENQDANIAIDLDIQIKNALTKCRKDLPPSMPEWISKMTCANYKKERTFCF